MLAKVYAELECNMELLGATAIEDKLQDGVPDTIQLLRDAGIRVWMLTGDKYSTAVQIAISCNLVSISGGAHDSLSPLADEDALVPSSARE